VVVWEAGSSRIHWVTQARSQLSTLSQVMCVHLHHGSSLSPVHREICRHVMSLMTTRPHVTAQCCFIRFWHIINCYISAICSLLILKLIFFDGKTSTCSLFPQFPSQADEISVTQHLQYGMKSFWKRQCKSPSLASIEAF